LLAVQQIEPKIQLRVQAYEANCVRAGLVTGAQQADAFGMSPAYISRVPRGLREVNAPFIAGVLATFTGCRFEDFFEVVGEVAELKAS
jgi:transcriptional regulator with XRE-family HTH domain